jgi:hypothetical protein
MKMKVIWPPVDRFHPYPSWGHTARPWNSSFKIGVMFHFISFHMIWQFGNNNLFCTSLACFCALAHSIPCPSDVAVDGGDLIPETMHGTTPMCMRAGARGYAQDECGRVGVDAGRCTRFDAQVRACAQVCRCICSESDGQLWLRHITSVNQHTRTVK